MSRPWPLSVGLSPGIDAILNEFGMLSIASLEMGEQLDSCDVSFDPTRIGIMRSIVRDNENGVTITLYPVGEADGGNIRLYSDEKGHTYAYCVPLGEDTTLIANTFDEALIRLLKGREWVGGMP